MRKFQIKGLMLLITLTIILSLCFSFIVIAADINKLEVKTTIGFNGNYKIGYSTPITLTINNTYKDIQGEIEIRVPSTPGKYMSYVKPISMQKSSEKVITINVPVSSTNRAKYAIIINNGKEKVYEGSVTLDSTSNNVTEFVGILSDDFDSVSYINKAPSPAGNSVVTKVTKLDEKTFPEDLFTLKSFDILVINDFDTSKFSKAQYELLKKWVTDGGTLLIGTGAKSTKTLGIFKDDFITGSAGNLGMVNTTTIPSIATNGDNNSAVKVEALTFALKDGTALIEDNNVKLLQKITKGKGAIGLAAFDFGQAPFINWSNNTTFVEKILALINPSLAETALYNVKMQGGQEIYSIRNIMNQFSEMTTAKVSGFYIILLIYIIVVAPLNYFVFKKLDKRELMWVTVPIISIVFSCIVYISGNGTRLSKVTANMVSIVNVDDNGNASVASYSGIYSPKKMVLKVESKEGQKLIPLSDNNNYGGDPNNQSGTKEEMEAKIFAVDNGGVEYHNTSILQTKVLQMQQGKFEIGKIEAEISMQNGSFTGKIKNSTNLDLEECYIITPSEYYKIEGLKTGETKDITTREGSYNGNLQQLFMGTINNNGNYINPNTLNESERKKYIDKQQRAAMIQLVFNYGNQKIQGVQLIAFSKTPINGTLLVNGRAADKNERTLINMPVKLNLKNGEVVEYPKGFIPTNILSNTAMKYDPYNNMFYGNGDAEIVYSIDKAIKVEGFSVDSISNLGTSNKNNSGTVIKPTLSIYNLKTNKYEELIKETFSGEDISNYVNVDNTVKIKISLSNNTGQSGMPQMSAKGRVK